MKRTLLAVLLGLILSLGALTGCGGGDEEDGEGVNPGLVEPGEDGEGSEGDD